METLILHRAPERRTYASASWRSAVLGLFMLSLLWNLGQAALIKDLDKSRREAEAQLQEAEAARDLALEHLEELSRQMEQDKQARITQTAAYEAVEAYQYIGECTITAYCPCEVCCGRWADGLTATGVPAGPGIVAVDPNIIPLGSTVIIDGQQYLAADTGVTGLHVDVCSATHQEANELGLRTADVWIEAGGEHG